MSENQEYLSVSEASRLTGKSEGTIRILLKELIQEYQNNPHTCTSLLVEVKGENKRQFYKISKEILLERLKTTITSTYTSSDETYNNTITSDEKTYTSTYTNSEIELLQQWLEEKNQIIADLRKRLDAREDEMANMQRLLENQQKMTLHGQLQVEKAQLLLEEKNQPRKKVLGLF